MTDTPEFRAGILRNATTEETARLDAILVSLNNKEISATGDSLNMVLKLAERVDISVGNIRVLLSTDDLADLLDANTTRLVEDFLTISSLFQHRKRGVETKLIIGHASSNTDEILLRNIARAHRYFDLVRSGKTFG